MSEWVFYGTVTLRGVEFFVEADTEEAAREKAKAGEWFERDDNGGECVDWVVFATKGVLSE